MLIGQSRLIGMQIQTDVSLREYTTFKIGGMADYYVAVHTLTELEEAVLFAASHDLPFFVLGGGSNVLVSDAGYAGLVIHMHIHEMVWESQLDGLAVRVGAGVGWDDFVHETVERGYYDVANLSSIPGTVGASPVQNIGAYGVEVAETITVVHVYDTTNRVHTLLQRDECMFAYRDSIFKHSEGKHFIITHVDFLLTNKTQPHCAYKDVAEYFAQSASQPTPHEVRTAICTIRNKKFPNLLDTGTAGSFFKNPIITRTQYMTLQEKYPDIPGYEVDAEHMKVPLAWILDVVCQLKGYTQGSVGLFSKQPLVVVNTGNARSADVDSLANYVAEKVFDATQIVIEREVRNV